MSITGVTAAGFIPKRLPEIIQEQEAGFRSAFGSDIDTTADSVIGQEIGVLSKPIADIWETLAVVAAGKSISGASGSMLEDIAFFRGINRRGATKATSRVALWKKLSFGALIVPSGTMVRASQLEGIPVFQLLEPVTISVSRVVAAIMIVSVTPTTGTVFTATLADLDGGNALAATYTSISGDTAETVAGYFAEIIAADTRFLASVDGSTITVEASIDEYNFQIVSYSGVLLDEIGTAGAFQSMNDSQGGGGPKSIDEIATPASGLIRCGNLYDIRPGTGIETDSELRMRVLNAFSSATAGTVDAIRNAVFRVSGVSFCNVQQNDSSLWRGVMPPNSIAIVADGELGIEPQIGVAIWGSKPGGIETIGTTTVPVVDGNGETKSVKFTRPVYTPASVSITVSQNPDASRQSDWIEKIKAAAVAIGSDYTLGVDMPAAAFYAAVYSVSGIGTATVQIGKGVSPVFTSGLLPVDPFEKLQFDVSRITVTG